MLPLQIPSVDLGVLLCLRGGWLRAAHILSKDITPGAVQERGYTVDLTAEDVLNIGISMVHSNWSWPHIFQISKISISMLVLSFVSATL